MVHAICRNEIRNADGTVTFSEPHPRWNGKTLRCDVPPGAEIKATIRAQTCARGERSGEWYEFTEYPVTGILSDDLKGPFEITIDFSSVPDELFARMTAVYVDFPGC